MRKRKAFDGNLDMRIWECLLMCIFTFIGIRYLADMVKFALGYEIHGKKRKPVVDLKKWKKRKPEKLPEEKPAAYQWENYFLTENHSVTVTENAGEDAKNV